MPFDSEPTTGQHSREPTARVHIDPRYREAATRPCERNRGSLLVLAGPNAGDVTTFDTRPATIGRARDCELIVDDTAASRYHAVCFRAENGFVLEDLGSANGTWIAGQRLHGRVMIDDGTRFLVGTTVIGFHAHDLFEQQATRRMRDRGLRDGLTNLWNRRYFDKRLRSELSYARRHHCPLTLMMIDIDHFKSINDEHGHLAGDAVLRQVARRLRRIVRPEDVVARYGGEEMAIISRGTAGDDAFAAAERIRDFLAREPLEATGATVGITVSVGISWTDGRGEVGTRDLLGQADSALYEAKTCGRNTVRGRPVAEAGD